MTPDIATLPTATCSQKEHSFIHSLFWHTRFLANGTKKLSIVGGRGCFLQNWGRGSESLNPELFLKVITFSMTPQPSSLSYFLPLNVEQIHWPKFSRRTEESEAVPMSSERI